MTRQRADHIHPETWTRDDHHRFEDRVTKEIDALRDDVKALTHRITLMLGGLSLIAVLLPVIAPFVRAWLNVDTPTGQ